MSTKLREIKRRIGSTGQIHKVTSALQRVSSARLGRDRRAIENSQRYTRKLIQLMLEICPAATGAAHPLTRRRHPVRTTAIVVFGADRGLCGSFNDDLVAALERFVERRGRDNVRLIGMGTIITRRARRAGYEMEQALAQPLPKERGESIASIVEVTTAGFVGGVFDEVHVLYSRFAPKLQHVPIIEQVLPVYFGGRGGALSGAEFEPEAETILRRLVPEFVYQSFDHAFLNSIGAENWARQEAMSRASRNAGELLDELATRYSRVRQEGITTEMIELAGGGQV
jgi:F-type H+-transporting ATPase subunit gamma